MTEDGGQQRPWWASPSDQLQEPPEPPQPPPVRAAVTDSTGPEFDGFRFDGCRFDGVQLDGFRWWRT